MKEEIYLDQFFDPIEIPAFAVKDPCNNEWRFPGANVDLQLNQEPLCLYSGADVILSTKGNLMTLAEHRALTELALAKIKKRNPEGIPEAALEGAVKIFYHYLHVALTTNNPYQSFQNFFGEWTNDAIRFNGTPASENYIKVKWIQRPSVKKVNEREYQYIESPKSRTIETLLPTQEGVVIQTVDGLYNPETGAPFAVDPTCKNDTSFLEAVAQEVNEELGRPCKEGKLIRNIAGIHPTLSRAISDGFDYSKLPLQNLLDLLRSGYGFSHNFDKESLDQFNPRGQVMVVMRGRDEIPDIFYVSLGMSNYSECGIQSRYSVRKEE